MFRRLDKIPGIQTYTGHGLICSALADKPAGTGCRSYAESGVDAQGAECISASWTELKARHIASIQKPPMAEMGGGG